RKASGETNMVTLDHHHHWTISRARFQIKWDGHHLIISTDQTGRWIEKIKIACSKDPYVRHVFGEETTEIVLEDRIVEALNAEGFQGRLFNRDHGLKLRIHKESVGLPSNLGITVSHRVAKMIQGKESWPILEKYIGEAVRAMGLPPV